MDFHFDNYERSRALKSASKDVRKAAEDLGVYILVEPKSLAIVGIKADNKEDVNDLLKELTNSIEALDSMNDSMSDREKQKDSSISILALLTYYKKELSSYVAGDSYYLN